MAALRVAYPDAPIVCLGRPDTVTATLALFLEDGQRQGDRVLGLDALRRFCGVGFEQCFSDPRQT